MKARPLRRALSWRVPLDLGLGAAAAPVKWGKGRWKQALLRLTSELLQERSLLGVANRVEQHHMLLRAIACLVGGWGWRWRQQLCGWPQACQRRRQSVGWHDG